MKALVLILCVAMIGLQGCIHKVVTVPVKVAYGTTKAVVKGTTTVVGAVIPDGDDEEEKEKKKD